MNTPIGKMNVKRVFDNSFYCYVIYTVDPRSTILSLQNARIWTKIRNINPDILRFSRSNHFSKAELGLSGSFLLEFFLRLHSLRAPRNIEAALAGSKGHRSVLQVWVKLFSLCGKESSPISIPTLLLEPSNPNQLVQ